MRIIFMGKKPAASVALEYLLENGIEVPVVVAYPHKQYTFWAPKLCETAKKHGIPVISDRELYTLIKKKMMGITHFL